MNEYAEFSRTIGQRLGSYPYTMEEREQILKETAKVDSIDKLSAEMQQLLNKPFSTSRALPKLNRKPKGGNPNHDGKTGKFTSSKGTIKSKVATPKLTTNNPIGDYDAITPKKGNTREKALASIQKTADGKRLVNVTKKWQGQSGEVEKIQKDFMTRAAGKKTRSSQRDAQMDVMMKGIKNAPPSDRELYRGVKLPKGTDVAGMKGKTMTLPPSSFSSDERISRQFVDRSAEQSETVILRARKGKMKGMPVELFGDPAYAYEKEWVSAGAFEITNVEKLPGRKGYVVDVVHTGMFSWEA